MTSFYLMRRSTGGGRVFSREHLAAEDDLPACNTVIQRRYYVVCAASNVQGLRTVKNFEVTVALADVHYANDVATGYGCGVVWYLVYVPEGANIDNVMGTFSPMSNDAETQMHTLVMANQWVICAGYSQYGSAARKICTTARRLNNGDRLFLVILIPPNNGQVMGRVGFSLSYDIAYN